MTSTFEKKCTFTLVSCLVSYLGLFLLNDQCSVVGIAITLMGIVGIGLGILGVVMALPARLSAKWGSGPWQSTVLTSGMRLR